MIELNLKLISNVTPKLAYLQTDNLEDLHSYIFNVCNWTPDYYYLRSNGNEVLHINNINGAVEIIPRLRGGKGGFGSMLRAIGAQIEKTTNREACRDLSGRRLRDINEEQRLKKWISQQAEREREIEEKRKKKLEKLSSEPRHEFQDETYFAERSEMCDKLNDAFEQGVQASTSSVKRKVEDDKPVSKKKKLLMDFDEFSSSDDAEESNDGSSGDYTITASQNTEEPSRSDSDSCKGREETESHSAVGNLGKIKNTSVEEAEFERADATSESISQELDRNLIPR